MNTLTFNAATPWTHAEVRQFVREQPTAVVRPLIYLAGGNVPHVVHLGRNEYLVAIVAAQGSVLRYGVLDEASYEDLMALVDPMQTSDYSYPQAFARAIDEHCYWQSETEYPEGY